MEVLHERENAASAKCKNPKSGKSASCLFMCDAANGTINPKRTFAVLSGNFHSADQDETAAAVLALVVGDGR